MIVAVAVCCASLYALAQAQTISGNTSNLINPAGTAWGIPGNQVMNSGGIGAIEGGGPTTGSAYYNQDTNTIRFSYMPSTVTQSIAINSALAGTGIKWLGYDYAWSIMNGGQASGPLRADIYLKSNNAVLETWTHNYAAGSNLLVVSNCIQVDNFFLRAVDTPPVNWPAWTCHGPDKTVYSGMDYTAPGSVIPMCGCCMVWINAWPIP